MRFGYLALPAAVILAVLATALAALPPASPDSLAPVLVVAGPWDDPDALILAAGGTPVGPRAPVAAMATGGEGFVDALFAAGAMFVLDAGTLARLCGVV